MVTQVVRSRDNLIVRGTFCRIGASKPSNALISCEGALPSFRFNSASSLIINEEEVTFAHFNVFVNGELKGVINGGDQSWQTLSDELMSQGLSLSVKFPQEGLLWECAAQQSGVEMRVKLESVDGTPFGFIPPDNSTENPLVIVKNGNTVLPTQSQGEYIMFTSIEACLKAE